MLAGSPFCFAGKQAKTNKGEVDVPNPSAQPTALPSYGFPLLGDISAGTCRLSGPVGAPGLPGAKSWCVFSNVLGLHSANDLAETQRIDYSERRFACCSSSESHTLLSEIPCHPMSARASFPSQHQPLRSEERIALLQSPEGSHGQPRSSEVRASSLQHWLQEPSSLPGSGSSSSWQGSACSLWCDPGGQEEGNARVSLLPT